MRRSIAKEGFVMLAPLSSGRLWMVQGKWDEPQDLRSSPNSSFHGYCQSGSKREDQLLINGISHWSTIKRKTKKMLPYL